LITNTHPVPTVASSKPATAGPIIRAALNDVEFGDKGLARRRIERRGASKQKRKHVHVPQLNDPGDGEDTQTQSQGAHGRLGGKQEFPPVQMIRREASQWQQEDLRPKLERHDHTDSSRIVVSQLGEDEPVLGSALHPCPDIRHDRPASPHPIIEASQRTKSAFHLLSYSACSAIKASTVNTAACAGKIFSVSTRCTSSSASKHASLRTTLRKSRS